MRAGKKYHKRSKKKILSLMEEVEWTKVKYTHSRDTFRNPFEH
jgi:hypothetical protein